VEEGCAEDDEKKANGEDLNTVLVHATWVIDSPRAYEGERNDGL
jgi:hypothetical protein